MHIHQLVLGELDTNCYIVWDSTGQALVIDPADDSTKILNFLDQEGLTLAAVVLSHAHFDHMLAAEELCAATEATLYVGRGDVSAMTDPIRNLSGLFTPGHSIKVADYAPLTEADTLKIGEMTFTILETPGHTPGCICLHLENYLFAGDTLFQNSIGRLDFPGGDSAAMFRSLQRLMHLSDDTVVYPGHGPSTTIGHEKRFNPYLR